MAAQSNNGGDARSEPRVSPAQQRASLIAAILASTIVSVDAINRHDFGISWQDELPMGGVVVSSEIRLTLDVEAILDEDLEKTGAIRYYRDAEEVPSEVQAGTADAA